MKTNRRQTRKPASIDLDAYGAEESREEARHFAGLNASERAELRQVLDCGSSGHLPLARVWRTLTPESDGRLHATCPVCRASVSRSAFVN